MSTALAAALALLGRQLEVQIDRPLGSAHPRMGWRYPCNYGEIPHIRAPDGGGLDAYCLGVSVARARLKGVVVAVIERIDDDDPKLVVVPAGADPSDAEIEAAVGFQEQWFKHRLHRRS